MEDEKQAMEDEKQGRSAKELAAAHKKQGNSKYQAGDYYAALDCYTAAIQADPSNSSYYGNRAAAKLMVNQSRRAVDDCRKAIELDNTNVKTHNPIHGTDGKLVKAGGR